MREPFPRRHAARFEHLRGQELDAALETIPEAYRTLVRYYVEIYFPGLKERARAADKAVRAMSPRERALQLERRYGRG